MEEAHVTLPFLTRDPMDRDSSPTLTFRDLSLLWDTVSPWTTACGAHERDLVLDRFQVLSVPLAQNRPSEIKTTRQTKKGEKRQKEEGWEKRCLILSLPRPYRHTYTGGGIAREKAYRAAFPSLHVLFIPVRSILSSCPHSSLCLVLYGAENYWAVDSVFPLARIRSMKFSQEGNTRVIVSSDTTALQLKKPQKKKI